MSAERIAGILDGAIRSHAFPAAVIEIGRRTGVTWRQAFGRLTYAPDAAVTNESTIFDLASLTKVIATATLVMETIDRGPLRLDDTVAAYLKPWRGDDREHVTIADLLEHTSGLTAYLPFFRDHTGRSDFERAICTLPLEYTPRTQSVYSDLGFILLGFILEDVNRAPLSSQFATLAKQFALGEKDDVVTFNPPRSARDRAAPTELDLWRGRMLQGEVHDENTWVLGGAAGHAGLFGTASAVGAFARLMLQGLHGARSLARPETIRRFVTKSTVPGSSRALAWDTMLPTSSCGTRLSSSAIGHTGFTGTSLWLDPDRDLYVVLLTNRVHPTRDNHQIQPVRRQVHDAVVELLAGDRLS